MSQHTHLYNNRHWRARRASQLRHEPLCRFCQDRGIVAAAQIADHVEPHNGDLLKFWQGKLQSLCKSCHDSLKQQIDKRGYTKEIGLNGWPKHPNHPRNVARVK